MRKIASLLATTTLAAGLLSGCSLLPSAAQPAASKPPAKGAADNAAKAAAGALGRRGSLTGMLEGVLAGSLAGRYFDEEAKDGAQAARDYGYTAAQGSLLSFDSVRANPVVVAPGDTVNVNAEYTVLFPTAGQVVPVTETREFLKDGASLGKVSIEVERAAGTYRTTIPFTLAGGAPAGQYDVKVTIEAQGGALKDGKESYFKVTR